MPKVTTNLKIRGISTQPNTLGSVADGSMATADNVNLDRDDIARTRRGFKQYGNTLDAVPNSAFQYRDRQLYEVPGSGIVYDSDGSGNFVLTGSGAIFTPSGANKMHSSRANRNLYVTSDKGIQKLDSLTADWVLAGAPRGLDGSFSLTGDSGFLADDTAVAYRCTFSYTDANNNEIEGFPSNRVVASNSTGSSAQVSLTFQIPDGVISGYVFRVYRSAASSSALTAPNDNLQLVYEADITAAQLTAGEITITDNVPAALLGANLYTNQNEQTILQGNNRPPFALDTDVYQDFTFFANTTQEHQINVALLAASEESFGYIDRDATSVSGSNFLATATGTDFRVGMRVESPDFSEFAFIDSVASSGVYTDITATGTSTVSTQFQDYFFAADRTYYATDANDFSNQEFEAVLSSTPGLNIQDTTNNLISAINQDTGNSSIYGYYTSPFDGLPGQFSLIARDVDEPQFFIASNATSAFSPQLSTDTSETGSDNQARPNGLSYSKAQIPDSVPFPANTIRVGSAEFPIDRILALRDSLFIFKDGDGCWQLQGNDPANFRLRVFDDTLNIIAPELAVTLANAVYLFSNQGFVRLNEGGIEIISRDIEDIFDNLSAQLTNFASLSFGVSYEVERKYIAAVPSASTDTHPTQIYTFNYITNNWSRWTIESNCGQVLTSDDKLYLAFPDSIIRQERKNFDRTDFTDEEYDLNITSSDGTTVNVDSVTNLAAGQTLKQNGRESVITSVDASSVEVEDELSWGVGLATSFVPINARAVFNPITGKTPGIVKHWIETTFLFRDADFNNITAGFSTNFDRQEDDVTLTPRDIGGAWGASPWGSFPWGGNQKGQQPIRADIPPQMTRGTWLTISLELNQAFSSFSLEGMQIISEDISSRIR